MLLCLLQRYQEGNRFGQLAVDLLQKYPHSGRAAEVMNMQCAWIRHWIQPVNDQIEPLKTYHQKAMQTGDIEWALYCLLNYTLLLWGSGKHLGHYIAEVEPSIVLCQSKNQQFSLQAFLMFAQSAFNLTGRSSSTTQLEGKWFSEETMMSRLEGNRMLLALYGLLKMTLCYLFGDPQAAYRQTEDVLKFRGSLNPHYLYTKISLYGALACVDGLADAGEEGERQERLERLKPFEEDLKLWAEVGPMNYRHEYDLLQAEKCRVGKDHWQAVRFYEMSITGAHEGGFVHEEALAHELCARFWHECGNDKIAEMYMRDARRLYHQWGAHAKVSHLEQSYPQWFEGRTVSDRPEETRARMHASDQTLTQPITPIQLELDEIVRASQALSSETDLDRLLTKMMELVMSDSGAARAVLLLKKGDEWLVQARGDVQAETHEVLLHLPFDPEDGERNQDLVPGSVFNYCRRSGEAVVVADARRDRRFSEDPLIKKHSLKSLACIPALSQGELKAILYLENRHVTDVFTQRNVEILRHLSSQFGTSVEKALLYEDLNRKVRELQESEARFRNLMEQSPLATEILSPDGRITEVNSAWMRLWGVKDDREKTLVLAAYNMLTDPQVKDLGILPLVHRAFAGEHVVLPPIEYSSPRAGKEIGLDGVGSRTPWIQCYLYPVKDANGDIAYVVNKYMDITDLKHAEQESREQREALARASRATRMGQLTGSIAHELNQPLTGILSTAQAGEMLIQRNPVDRDELAEILAAIVSDVKRAGEVIRNLRDLYREQKGESEPVDINTIVDETSHLLHSEFVLQDVEFTTDCAPCISRVNGNRVQLQQVLVNLIMNGTQAMSDLAPHDRRLHVVTTCDRRNVKVWIDDNGPGIAAEKINQIFEPLATWKPGGMGMGLAISNSIIQAHGGSMWAENRSSGGARVGFTLPALPGAQADE